MIEVSNLSKSFLKKRKKVKVLDNICLSLKSNTVIGLIGPNGAGKTTLIKILCGLITNDKGNISIMGYSIPAQLKHIRHRISVMLEGTRNIYWRLTVLENIRFFLAHKGILFSEVSDNVEELLDIFSLRDARDTEVRKLSQGMKQKVAVIICLASNPDIIFLDEPTLGMDYLSRCEMIKTIKEIVYRFSGICLVSSHDFKFIEEISTDLLFLENGKIVYNGPINIFNKSSNIPDYYFYILEKGNKSFNSSFGKKLRLNSKTVKVGVSGTHLINIIELLSKEKKYFELVDIEKEEKGIEKLFK